MSPARIVARYVVVASCILACMVMAGQEVSPQNQHSMSARIALLTDNPESTKATKPKAVAMMLLDEQSRSISFQALLTNEMGNPINNPNGQHELDFRLYDNNGGGEPVGEVLDVVVILNDGVASTSVGPMDPDWFDGSARCMGVTVDNGSELTPLIALGSVPYAFRVDRVASEELDNNIDLGDANNGGSIAVFSGDVTPETITLDGPTGVLTVQHPTEQGRIILRGFGQLIETRDNNDTLVALYGHDAFGGGAACLLGTDSGSTGLLLDGDDVGNTGGAVKLFNAAAEETVSMTAVDATIRAGSPAGGVPGNMHLFPTDGGPSTIHLDGAHGDMRLGLNGFSSGDLKLHSVFGGTESIRMNGGLGTITLSNTVSDTITIDGSGVANAGHMFIRNSDGTHGLFFGGNSADITSQGQMLNLNRNTNQDIAMALGGGNVGIGTASPNHELVVQGDDPAFQIRDDVTDNSANAARIELLENAGGTFNGGAFLWWNVESNKFHIGTKVSGNNTSVIVIDRATNNVGIGTQTPGNHRLAVNGKIRAKEIVVETGWSDFVFEADYKLPTLAEVEAHIKKHGHLSDIPSAKDVAKNGVALGEMDSKLLQKVEELTLHLIDMNKRLQSLEMENTVLHNAMNTSGDDAKEAK